MGKYSLVRYEHVTQFEELGKELVFLVLGFVYHSRLCEVLHFDCFLLRCI